MPTTIKENFEAEFTLVPNQGVRYEPLEHMLFTREDGESIIQLCCLATKEVTSTSDKQESSS